MSHAQPELARQLTDAAEHLARVRAEVGKVIVGQRDLVYRLLVGLVARGHILLEGLPGLAKTAAVSSLARATHCQFSRIQFTPDLLPGDITGTLIYDAVKGTYSTRQGPIFANLVLADVAILDSLPVREFRAGYAEVVKYGLINDAPFFEWLEKHEAEIMAGGPARAEAIRVSCAAKAAIVMRDEREDGERALLNLGHTFAHAFERLTNYDGSRLVHGEAVAIGLVCAFNFSVKRGLATRQDAVRVERHLHKAGLPTHIADIPGWNAGPDAIIDAMLQDKKVSRGQLTFILARGIGQSFIAKGVEASDVREFLNEELAREAA